jgi:SAM-dependent methyltransferase
LAGLTQEQRQKTLDHLEEYFSTGLGTGEYRGHQPVFGFGQRSLERYQIVFLARVHHILQRLATFQFDSFLDVGGGEGYIANLVQLIFGARATTCDLSLQANLRARELFDLDSLVVDAGRLPFPDHSFDVVLCSEVIEHLENPIPALRELVRVSRRGVVISTMEAALTRWERWLRVRLRDLERPHTELNWWHPGDFDKILGTDGLSYSHILNIREYAEAGYDDARFTEQTAKALVSRMVVGTRFGTPRGVGILLVKRTSPDPPVQRFQAAELLECQFAAKLPLDYHPCPAREWISDGLAATLCCPVCRSPLGRRANRLSCDGCAASYSVAVGIPMMQSPAWTEPRPSSRLEARYRRLFSPQNLARGRADRQATRALVSAVERWRSFQASPDLQVKARKVARLLLGAPGRS